MTVSIRTRLGAAAVAVAAASLLASTSAPAVGAPAAPAAADERAGAPVLSFKVTSTGRLVKTSGPSQLRGGRVDFKVVGAGDGALGFVKFDRGYSLADFKRDFRSGQIARVYNKATFLGGAGVERGQTRRGSVKLPAGRVYAWNEKGAIALRVRRPARRPAVNTSGVVKALDGHKWGGSNPLEGKGKTRFVNKGSQPHFVEFNRVDPGTTKQEILEYFQTAGPGSPPPSWYRSTPLYTDVISPGRSMVINHGLPRGTYALLCWMPDPTMDGMPHAMMGMVRVIRVR